MAADHARKIDPTVAARYQLQDADGTLITEGHGRVIITQRYAIPPETRAARRQVTNARQPRRMERAKIGVAKRTETPPVPQPA